MNPPGGGSLHPRLRRAATLPVGRALLVLLIATWAAIALGVISHRIKNGDVAWFLAALSLTFTLLLLTCYDIFIDVLHLANKADATDAPERFSLHRVTARSELVKWARRVEGHLAWLAFGVGIVGGHLWWH